MSFGSHNLLRPCFSARLPFCTPRTKLGQCRLPSVRSQCAKYISGDAPAPNTAVLSGSPSDNGYFSNTSLPRHQSQPDVPPSDSTLTATSDNNPNGDHQNESSLASRSVGRRRPVRQRATKSRVPRTFLLSRSLAMQIVQKEEGLGGHAKTPLRRFPLIYHCLYRRPVSKESMYMEARVTLAALYTRHDAQEWRRALRRVFFAKRNGLGSDDPMRPTLTEDGLALLREIQSDCLGRFSEVWKGLDKTQKAEHWQRLALWLLRNSPEHMLEFLLVTTQGLERPLFKMITDCFHFLETFHLDELGTWRKGGHTFRSILQTSLHPETWPVAVLPQAGVRLYTRWGDYETIVLAFDTMWRRKSQISAVLALIFMRDFTYYHDVKRAMKALWLVFKLKQPGFGMNSTSVNRHCCKLLTLDTVKDGPDGRNFRILPKLLQMGVNPTLPMMNILLSNAFKTGDPQMGFDMLQFMKSQGFEFDKYTYMEMLKDGVAREDRAQVQSVVAEILQNEELQRNPLLLNKIFHAHYAFTAKHMESNADPAEVFYSVLSMYNKLHDIKPLKELTIIPPHYEPPSGSGDTQPSLVPLYVMIATYLRCQRRIPVVQRIYSRFRELVKGGHESIAPLAATDHTYNEFLTALRGSPEGLRPSVRIVEDMLQSEPVDIYNGEHKVRRADHAKPTFRTWTILMSAFLYNGHLSAAERVKEMMARYNIPFNDVTWNVIISGYANLQKIPEAAQAIKTMESQGYPIDSYTMKGLRFLKDPERLWSAVEELDRISQDGLGLDENDRNTVADRSQEEDSENVLDQRLQHLKERMSR